MKTANESRASSVRTAGPYRNWNAWGRLTAPMRRTCGTIQMMIQHKMNQGMGRIQSAVAPYR